MNGEGDGIGGLIIDYYAGYYVLSWYSEGIYTFKDEIIRALENVAEFKAIYQKKRFDTKGNISKRMTLSLENAVSFRLS